MSEPTPVCTTPADTTPAPTRTPADVMRAHRQAFLHGVPVGCSGCAAGVPWPCDAYLMGTLAIDLLRAALSQRKEMTMSEQNERDERPAWEVAWERDRYEVTAATWNVAATDGVEAAVREGYRLGFEAGLRATGQAADNLGDALLRLVGGTGVRARGEG